MKTKIITRKIRKSNKKYHQRILTNVIAKKKKTAHGCGTSNDMNYKPKS